MLLRKKAVYDECSMDDEQTLTPVHLLPAGTVIKIAGCPFILLDEVKASGYMSTSDADSVSPSGGAHGGDGN